MKPYYEHAGITIYHGDCREILPTLGRFNLVLTDPPYGVTAHGWDQIVHPSHWMIGGSCVCTATEPFATGLINCAPQQFRFDCVWVKNQASNVFNAGKMPLRTHERILVFGDYQFSPVMRLRSPEEVARYGHARRGALSLAHPGSVIEFPCVSNPGSDRFHPSQKPIALMDYLLKSYSAGSVVDPFSGSGTTLLAAKNMNLIATGIEINERYCEIAAKRLQQEVMDFGDVA